MSALFGPLTADECCGERIFFLTFLTFIIRPYRRRRRHYGCHSEPSRQRPFCLYTTSSPLRVVKMSCAPRLLAAGSAKREMRAWRSCGGRVLSKSARKRESPVRRAESMVQHRAKSGESDAGRAGLAKSGKRGRKAGRRLTPAHQRAPGCKPSSTASGGGTSGSISHNEPRANPSSYPRQSP